MRMLWKGPLGLVAVLSLGLLYPATALAVEGQLLLPSGEPAVGYQVSVVGLTVSATTNSEGRFRIVPDPRPPFRVIATGPNGEVFPPVDVDQLPEGALELTLTSAFKDTITVATGVTPNIEAPPAAGTLVLGQEELEQRRPPRLHDALQGVAGASRTDETATGVPVLRGLGRGRTLILLDGARVTTERRAGASASFLDPFTLSSVEIARGPGSVAYGSDAFGGVIDARPRYPEPGNPGLHFQVDQGFAAEDETAAGVDISRDLAGGALQAQVTWRESGIQEAGGGEEIPGSEYEDRSGALRYTRDTRIGRLRAGFYAAEATDVGKPASDWDTVQTTYPEEESRRFNLQLDSGPLSGGWENLELALFLGTYRLVTDRDRVAATPRLIESSDVDANDGSLRAVASREALGGRLLIGTEYVTRFGLEALTSQETLNPDGERLTFTESFAIEDAQQTDAAVFTTFDRALGGKAVLSVGLRGDQVETENQGGFFGDRSTDHAALSGHAAITVGPFRDVIATFQVARGFRDPFLSDRYFRGPSGRGFITGNPDLDPERSLQYDASVRWSVGGGSVGLFGYFYEIEDLIERFRVGQDFFFRNLGEAEVRGLELEGLWPLPANLSLEVAAAWARGESGTGDPIDDIAAPNGSATLRWGGERGFAFLRGVAVMEDDRPGPIEVERPSHSLIDIGAGWRIREPLELRLIGRNLTDERYHDSADEVASLGRGRSFSIGIVGRY